MTFMGNRIALGTLAAALVLSACSGGGESAEDESAEAANETTTTAPLLEPTIPTTLPPIPSELEELRLLWFEAGASWELADCYARVFETAGYGDVTDYEAMAQAQTELAGDDLAAFTECSNEWDVRS